MQLEVDNYGSVSVRITKQAQGYHRTLIPPGGDVARQLAMVNTHLEAMGENPITPEQIREVEMYAKTAWTPEVLSNYMARVVDA